MSARRNGRRSNALLNGNEMDDAKPTVPQLFEAVAAKAGDDTAVLFEGKAVGYAALNSAANRLARYLIARGVGRHHGDFVPVALDHAELVGHGHHRAHP
ncbi:hypothetical protein, partial [Streptomyces diastatochromogenes]|uniref:hypothetical protein n=1 Tax=Streptomyces diastatochromogenes TaxID=42236 RepID=UPI003674BB06